VDGAERKSVNALRAAALAASVALALAWSLGPYLWQVVTSLKPGEELASLPPLLPSRIEWSHYALVFAQQPFERFLWNSFVVAACSTMASLALALPAAFAIAKLPLARRGLWMGFYLSVSMLPPIATVSPLYVLVESLGLRDTPAGLVLPYTTYTLPLAVWVLASYLRELPDDLYRAARVDGCGPARALGRVFLPLSLPGLLTTAILVFIFAWNEFLFALTLTATERSRTVPVAIVLFPGLHEVPWGEIAAASVIVTFPLLVLVFLFQRRIVSGVTAGAVRGGA
jgi:multiple sugar transport system permease protein